MLAKDTLETRFDGLSRNCRSGYDKIIDFEHDVIKRWQKNLK